MKWVGVSTERQCDRTLQGGSVRKGELETRFIKKNPTVFGFQLPLSNRTPLYTDRIGVEELDERLRRRLVQLAVRALGRQRIEGRHAEGTGLRKRRQPPPQALLVVVGQVAAAGLHLSICTCGDRAY